MLNNRKLYDKKAHRSSVSPEISERASISPFKDNSVIKYILQPVSLASGVCLANGLPEMTELIQYKSLMLQFIVTHQ